MIRILPRPKHYLDYEKVKAAHTPDGDITVLCYFNGRYWVCPNPEDVARSKALEKQYEDGFFIECEVRKISAEAFHREDIWSGYEG
jgi:hypothetical protein